MELSKQTKSQCYNSFIVVVVVSNKTLKQCDFNIYVIIENIVI